MMIDGKEYPFGQFCSAALDMLPSSLLCTSLLAECGIYPTNAFAFA